MIEVLVPAEAQFQDQLKRVTNAGVVRPFDPLVLEFADAVSKAALLDPEMRRMPEMFAVAHWMRKAHLLDVKRHFESCRGERLWLARGIVLHFAPANVDSIFIYSWFLAMLLGNANIIRLSSRRGEQVEAFLTTIQRVLAQERFHSIRDSSLVLGYEHDESLTRQLSELCHLRVIWGGDESVRRLRAIPVNPLASELVFANRYSLAVLNARAVIEASEEDRAKLAARFYNDSYWFDQMACSSPRLVVWVGDAPDCRSAQEVFWNALNEEVARRGIEYPDVVGINKMVSAYVAAASGIADHIAPSITGIVGRVHLRPGVEAFRNVECGGGLFFETELPGLDQLRALLNQRDQTLCYFGFEKPVLLEWAQGLPIRAVDRIVPVGAALDFNISWDGNDLLRVFTREVDIQ